MLTSWPSRIFLLTFLLLAILMGHEVGHLRMYRQAAPTLSLNHFRDARKLIAQEDRKYLLIWESMLTGKSRSLRKADVKIYQDLGLSHLFTPSGFHLSAVTAPLFKVIASAKLRFAFLGALLLFLLSLQGQSALKRMGLIKFNQHWMGRKEGFAFSIGLDFLIGSFSKAPMSFTLSLLFLGLIYSGQAKFVLIMGFFFAQCLIGYFFHSSVPVLIIVLNPILNALFALAMPVLLLFSFPLWEWQLFSGIKLIRMLDVSVIWARELSSFMPSLEITLMLLLLPWMKRRYVPFVLLLHCGSLNLDYQRTPSEESYHFRPQGNILREVQRADQDVIYWSDGKCVRRLVRGFWWEKCSPKRRSTRKSIKKLSYL